jgi:hypothetical protein
MKNKALSFILIVAACSGAGIPSSAQEKEKKKEPPKSTGWCYVSQGPVEVRPKTSERKTAVVRLGRGALAPVFEVKQAGGKSWTRIQAVNPAKLTAEMGWVISSQVEVLPASQFPPDAELLKLLGGAYLDDFTAGHTAFARFLVRQGKREPAMACFLGAPILPQARLQVFLHTPGKWVVGPSLEFAFPDLQAGVTRLEIRDLLGDGDECLVTRETFRLGPQNEGLNLVIRKIAAGAFQKLWQAPVELRNLASFPPKLQILTPPEKNIGAPGTVTKGDVDFRARDRINEPVWKGEVEFLVFGREQPVETVTVEKVCAWDGTKFAPLY